jgi:hypothetical protein
MTEDYYSVLLCIRDKQTEVYINGLPVVDIKDSGILLRTKERDLAATEAKISKALLHLEYGRQKVIEAKSLSSPSEVMH